MQLNSDYLLNENGVFVFFNDGFAVTDGGNIGGEKLFFGQKQDNFLTIGGGHTPVVDVGRRGKEEKVLDREFF